MTWTHIFRFKKGGVAYLASTTHPNSLCSQRSFSGFRQMVWHSSSKEVLAIVKVASVWLHSMSRYAWKTPKNSWNTFLLVLHQYVFLFPFSWHWITLLAENVSCKLENILSWCLISCDWNFPSWLVCVFSKGMSEIKHRAAAVFWDMCGCSVLSIVHSLDEEFKVCDPACSLQCGEGCQHKPELLQGQGTTFAAIFEYNLEVALFSLCLL